MTWERILKVAKTYNLIGQSIKNPNPYLNLGEIPMRIRKFWGNLHFRFCKNGLAKRAALPWLSWKVLFWFWCLNSVLPQETFIMYLLKVTFSTNIWTFPELMETLNQPTFCKICKCFAEYIPLYLILHISPILCDIFWGLEVIWSQKSLMCIDLGTFLWDQSVVKLD